MTDLQFISTDAQQIIKDMVADYEAMTGRVLQPAQVERLLINAFAYREYLLRSQINEAARMNLVSFSRAPFLDYLGELVGVRRLLASPAVCTLRLTLVAGHGSLVIPLGTRIQTIDGAAVFALDKDTLVAPSDITVDVAATCLTSGKVGSNYAPGAVAVILDPQPYLLTAINIDETSGGADAETDDELRERIKLAPQSFSVAGSIGAYKYFARSANAGIIDVSVTSPIPGQVNIYPLMENGQLPNAQVLQEVYDACNAEKVRPLTDTVIVQAPTPVSYQIDVTLTLLTGAVAGDVTAAVLASLQAYADSRKQRCGLDIVRDKIVQRCMLDNVYDITVNHPTATISVDFNEVAICSGITISVGGYSDE
ncbi:MAG: baseplate J/gp47 family protein [Bacteroidetes bacterium]|nr:baseplate J/gp47 family protein [Bacteroidota bacterium]